MRCSRSRVLVIGLAVASCAVIDVRSQETFDERRARIDRMSAIEKDELRRNQERFLKLDNQTELRELDQQLSKDPRGDELRKVMLRYHEWLRALPSAERADLLSLSEEDRIPKIKEMLKKQETDRLRELAKESLSPEDVEQVRVWLAEMVLRRKAELLEQLPEEIRNRLKNSDDARRIMFEWSVHTREKNKPPMLTTSALKIEEAERQQLVEKLSTKARDFYRKAGGKEEDKQLIVQNWIFSTFRPHRPSTQELQDFLQRLPAETRDRLENLPPEQMKAELTRRFYDYRRWYQEGKRPSFPGDRPNDRSGEPRRNALPAPSDGK